MNKLPISALVVSSNEGFLLEDCLKSISFCDEIVLVNMESTDLTKEIGEKYAVKYIEVKKVELVEHLFPKSIPDLFNEWVMLIDPDERIDVELRNDIENFFKEIPNDCGKINVPIQYYYKKRALKGTFWGGENKYGRLLIKKTACDISDNVHTAISLKKGYLTYKIKRNGNNIDHHFWVSSFKQMLEKHKRYIKREGESRYKNGDRYSILKAAHKTILAFKESFLIRKGYKDGFLGLFLSVFYAWYIWASWNSLLKFQKNIDG